MFYKHSPNIITHEAWHGLEFILFQKRKVLIDMDGFNEHIAYYLGFLAENITKCLEHLTNK